MNVLIFHILLRILNILTNIPGQVERQQPVYLVDALGRHSPFHLEFMRSVEVRIQVELKEKLILIWLGICFGVEVQFSETWKCDMEN